LHCLDCASVLVNADGNLLSKHGRITVHARQNICNNPKYISILQIIIFLAVRSDIIRLLNDSQPVRIFILFVFCSLFNMFSGVSMRQSMRSIKINFVKIKADHFLLWTRL
jgi:hypothetical protein